MQRHLSLLLGAALLASSAATADSASTIAATPATVCPADGSLRPRLPSAHASLATGIATLHGRAAWMVGTHAGQGIPRRPWILRRSGSGWVTVPAASAGSDAGLMAVAAGSDSLAWAVGFNAVGRFLHPVSQRWDGRRWSAVPVAGAGRSEALTDVAITDAGVAWTVGFRTTGRGPRPVARRAAGRTWVRQDPSIPAGAFGSLTAVDAAPDGTVWAAGWTGDGTALEPLLVHWSGSRWSRVRTGLEGAAETVLTDVRASTDGRVVVLGATRRGAQLRGVLWTFDRGTWTADATLTRIAGSLIPDGVATDAHGRTAFGGAWRGPDDGGFAATIGVDGASGWGLLRAMDGLHAPSHLRDVTWSDGFVVGAGWTGGEGIAAMLCDPAGVATTPAGVADADDPWVTAPGREPGVGAQADGSLTPPRAAAGGLVFRDLAASVGLSETTISYGATVLDIDGDGWQDLLISRHTERGRLLRNRGGRFVAAAGDPLPALDRHGCAAADIDRDGRDEAYCAVGAARGAKIKNGELWDRLETARPRQLAAAVGVDDPLGRGRRATFTDLDGDPFPDLVITSDPLRVDGLPSLDRAFRNDHGQGFVSAGDVGLELPIGGSCVVTADLDGDGRQEIAICAEEAWGAGPGLHVFRRTGGRFRDATTSLGISGAGTTDAAAGDLDGDGRSDLVQLSSGRLAVDLQRRGGLSRVTTLGVSGAVAVTLGDADGDGDRDIYVVEQGDDRLLLNTGDGRHYRVLAISGTHTGSADDVVALDHDHDGRDGFLVLNGAAGRGPIQLIEGVRG